MIILVVYKISFFFELISESLFRFYPRSRSVLRRCRAPPPPLPNLLLLLLQEMLLRREEWEEEEEAESQGIRVF